MLGCLYPYRCFLLYCPNSWAGMCEAHTVCWALCWALGRKKEEDTDPASHKVPRNGKTDKCISLKLRCCGGCNRSVTRASLRDPPRQNENPCRPLAVGRMNKVGKGLKQPSLMSGLWGYCPAWWGWRDDVTLPREMVGFFLSPKNFYILNCLHIKYLYLYTLDRIITDQN